MLLLCYHNQFNEEPSIIFFRRTVDPEKPSIVVLAALAPMGAASPCAPFPWHPHSRGKNLSSFPTHTSPSFCPSWEGSGRAQGHSGRTELHLHPGSHCFTSVHDSEMLLRNWRNKVYERFSIVISPKYLRHLQYSWVWLIWRGFLRGTWSAEKIGAWLFAAVKHAFLFFSINKIWALQTKKLPAQNAVHYLYLGHQ